MGLFGPFVAGGFMTDLLPVIPPGAAISQTSNTLNRNSTGKIPGKQKEDDTWVGFSEFQRYRAMHSDPLKWASWGANVGIQCRAYPAVDIDLNDAVLVERVRLLVVQYLGETPVRYRDNSFRVLLPFHCEGWRKQSVQFGKDADGKLQAVEVLGTGNQFVAAGMHPSGARYQWHGGSGADGSPATSDVPKVTLEQLSGFVTALRAMAEGLGYPQKLNGERRAVGNENSYKPVMAQADVEQHPGVIEIRRIEQNRGIRVIKHTPIRLSAAGSFEITCPDILSHTDGLDNGTAVWPYQDGTLGFTCLHESCGFHRGREKFIQWLLEKGGESFLAYHQRYDVEMGISGLSGSLSAEQIIESIPLNTEDNSMLASEDYDRVLAEIVSASLSRYDADRVLQAIKSRYKDVRLMAMRDDLRSLIARQQSRDETIEADAGRDIMLHTLRTFYENGERLIHTEDGSFWEYTGTHWCRVPEQALKKHISTVVNERASLHADGRGREISHAHLMNSAFQLMAAHTSRRGDPLHFRDDPPPVINCANGELWLEDSGPVLRPHSPESGLTSCSGITYDGAAQCPVFDWLVLGIFLQDTALVEYALEQMGYLIQPRRSLKSLFLWLGSGNNGKTKLAEVVTRIIGLDAVLAEPITAKVSEDKHLVAELAGRLLHLDDDMNSNTLLPDGYLKKVSEAKLLTGQYKYKDRFSFISRAAVLMLANNPPSTRDISVGLVSRMEVLPFGVCFLPPNQCSPGDPRCQRPDLWDQVFASELAGVLNRLVRAFYQLKARGAFRAPPVAAEARREWLSSSNNLLRFVDEVCIRVDESQSTLLADVHSAYVQWCIHNGIEERYRVTRYKMKSRLEAAGITCKRRNDGQAAFGLVTSSILSVLS